MSVPDTWRYGVVSLGLGVGAARRLRAGGPAEKAGQTIDEAVEDTGKEIQK
jgi:hypothetical protein